MSANLLNQQLSISELFPPAISAERELPIIRALFLSIPSSPADMLSFLAEYDPHRQNVNLFHFRSSIHQL
jgi:hypothetical protein